MELAPAEDAVLVCRHRKHERLEATLAAVFGAAGAVLAEQVAGGRLVLTGGRLVRADRGGFGSAATGSVTDTLWETISAGKDEPRAPRRWMRDAVKAEAYAAVRAGLAERGVARADRGRFLLVFPVTRWTESDPAPCAAVRERVAEAVRQGRPGERLTVLAVLADACGQLQHLPPELDKRSRADRVADLAARTWRGGETAAALLAVAAALTRTEHSAEAAQIAAANG
ncbi:GOLPH3/VPS74 family protein [Streptomyces sp. IBSBF 2435]|uniref:GOLPH3/VPS74 family protein n=1 Tax=Streptomyces sp. IBSBF 2435 TaxID=2903531 RepID=UPI002FDBD29D